MEVAFYVSASLAVISMGCAMVIPHAIHALLCAIFSLISLAVSMYVLSAPLAAGLQVIVYAGAIMVLFVFAVMFLQIPASKNNPFAFTKTQAAWATMAFLAFWTQLSVVLNVTFLKPTEEILSLEDISVGLFVINGFVLELISFILLAGLIAAIFVGRRFMAQRGLLEE